MSNASDRFKSFQSAFVKGVGALGVALTDSPTRARISEIDDEIANLQDERDYLIDRLVEPLPTEKVSERFVPGKYTPKNRTTPEHEVDGARLVECKGRNSHSLFHDAHPACPYVDNIHTAHDFMLRD